LEALLLTGHPFAPLFLEEPLVTLGEAAASSDAGDRFSSFMALVGGRFPNYNAPHWTTPIFSGWWNNNSNGFMRNQQQLPVSN
jgi:hypothetical protein